MYTTPSDSDIGFPPSVMYALSLSTGRESVAEVFAGTVQLKVNTFLSSDSDHSLFITPFTDLKLPYAHVTDASS